MNEFKIEITETLQRTVTITAETVDAALSKAHTNYSNGDIILDADNLVDVTINHIEVN